MAARAVDRDRARRLLLVGVGIALVVKYTERGQRARKVYIEEVSSGAEPIEAVGTAIAAFVGSAPADGQQELEKQKDKAIEQVRKMSD